MSVTAKVKTIRPETTDAEIQVYISVVDTLDSCLSAYDAEMQELTKALLIAFYVEQSTSLGQVTAEKTRTGASASYKTMQGQGLASNRYGQQLQSLPTYGCVRTLFKSNRFAKVITPCH